MLDCSYMTVDTDSKKMVFFVRLDILTSRMLMMDETKSERSLGRIMFKVETASFDSVCNLHDMTKSD